MLIKILLSLSVLFFSGCSFNNQVLKSNPYLITIKNKEFALHDTGFINSTDSSKELQIFSAGTLVFSLHVKSDRVCQGYKCLGKLDFNEKFFGFSHYEHFLEDILEFKTIYEGKDLIQTDLGFEQALSDKDFDISYKVSKDKLYFKDKLNNILIKISALGDK